MERQIKQELRKSLLMNCSLKIPLTIEQLVFFSLLIYIPIHLIEEWSFGFANWALKYWQIPGYSEVKWFIHNGYFIFFQILGYILFNLNKERFLPLGIGIVIWGIMNTANHIICSIVFRIYEPGIITSLLWIYVFVKMLQIKDLFNKKGIIFYSILSGLLYWAIPMTAFIEIDKIISR